MTRSWFRRLERYAGEWMPSGEVKKAASDTLLWLDEISGRSAVLQRPGQTAPAGATGYSPSTPTAPAGPVQRKVNHARLRSCTPYLA